MTTSSVPRGLLVVAYGNELRGDDSAAHLVARLLEQDDRFNGTVVAACQLLPELAEAIASHAAVCFVDARVPDDDPTVHVRRIYAEAASAPPLGHTMTPEQILALTECVAGVSPEAWVLSLPSQSFELGMTLSTVAERGARQAAEIIVTQLGTR